MRDWAIASALQSVCGCYAKSLTSPPPRQSIGGYRSFSGGHDARRGLHAGLACLGGPQKRSGEPSTGWFPLSVCSPCWGERFAFPFGLWGLLAPTPRRKLLKKLEQNFYVLLTFGFERRQLYNACPSGMASRARSRRPISKRNTTVVTTPQIASASGSA